MMNDDCVFCRILSGSIGTKLYEDEDFFIIRDINPKARLHYLAITREHAPLISGYTGVDALGRILKKISAMTDTLGLYGGYRLIINQGKDAEQSVQHLHIHILGGEPLGDLR